jgi:NADPH-dependent glutamate synthase beta subunit-like oxidoreductase
MNDAIKIHVMALPCAECGKTPCHAAFIKTIENLDEKSQYFNLIPLCKKHCIEHESLGTMEMANRYRNVKRYIEHKGWELGKTLWHRKLANEQ